MVNETVMLDNGSPEIRNDKLMQTFRMPRPLVAHLKAEALRGRRDLTAHVIR